MEKVGVLLVSYGSRASSIADALTRSTNYDVEIYDADKQKNPYILERSRDYTLGIDEGKIVEFARKHKDDIDFGIVGPEGPIIGGIRDAVERETEIPMICPSKKYAIEGSKVEQRVLMAECCPEANPGFEVFDPEKDGGVEDVKKKLWDCLDEYDNQVAVKPDLPATGKGVGVWGDHFNSREDIFDHFLTIYKHGKVLIEEKVEGEEFSLQFFSDGKHLIPTPAVRDYKRAFDGDLGPNTGGMGSYKNTGNFLPFMDKADWESGLKIGQRIFEVLKEGESNPGIRGLALYMAYTCSKDGIKVFEINTRPGDPEIMNLMPLVKSDFVEHCFQMIDGNLTSMDFEPLASVVTYAVPMTYGGFRQKYSGDNLVNLEPAYGLMKKHDGHLRIYPGSMEKRDDGKTYALGSRAVACVGLGEDIERARKISLEGVKALDGPLWNRWDIASKAHIERSIANVKQLRS